MLGQMNFLHNLSNLFFLLKVFHLYRPPPPLVPTTNTTTNAETIDLQKSLFFLLTQTNKLLNKFLLIQQNRYIYKYLSTLQNLISA